MIMEIESITTGNPGNYYTEASESEREQLRSWVNAVLLETEITVDFVKTNGIQRSMRCTLSETLGAQRSAKTSERKHNPEVCVVWDTEQSAWRSFRWDRVQRIQTTLEKPKTLENLDK